MKFMFAFAGMCLAAGYYKRLRWSTFKTRRVSYRDL